MLKDESFGDGLTKNNGWLKDELKQITAGAATPYEAAKKIFEYIRDNMSCTDYSAIWLSGPLRKVYQNKNGNVADINLLLTAALINYGFNASPVLLSTRDHGKVTEEYPIMSQLNYVISQVHIEGKDYFLDAAHNRLGFGCLDNACYNGAARIVNKEMPKLVSLSADSLVENKVSNAFFINDSKGITGTITTTLGQYESNRLRDKLVKSSKEEYFKDMKAKLSSEVSLTNTEIKDLKKFEEPVTLQYDLNFETKEDMLYLNPIFAEAYSKNPFTAAERNYPVEMPFKINETYLLRMEIPKGYEVEELPKPTRVKFNEDEGLFEYLISADKQIIQLRSTVKLEKAVFSTEDYKGLRDFFAYIVKKHSEQLVLKKVK